MRRAPEEEADRADKVLENVVVQDVSSHPGTSDGGGRTASKEERPSLGMRLAVFAQAVFPKTILLFGFDGVSRNQGVYP